MQGVAAVALMLGAVGASCDMSPNVYTPLTDPVTVGVINATPYRAIFTIGSYDNLDEKTIPVPSTALLESQANDTTGLGTGSVRTASINVNSFTPVTAVCRRAISIGAPEMIKLINDNKAIYSNAQVNMKLDERALITGVNFSDAALDSPDVANPTRGTAAPLTLLQGEDFPCGSYVIIRLVEDATAPGGFKAQLDGVIH